MRFKISYVCTCVLKYSKSPNRFAIIMTGTISKKMIEKRKVTFMTFSSQLVTCVEGWYDRSEEEGSKGKEGIFF